MGQSKVITGNPLATESIWKLLRKYAIPCVISLLVNSLYNMVDQIFIGRSVGYLGNGATNVVFPVTIIVLSIALMLGDGAATYLSIKLGEKNPDAAQRGIGSVITFSIIVSIVITAIIAIFLKQIIYFFGCTDNIFPYAIEYGRVVVIGLPFVLVGTVISSIERSDGAPQYSMLSLIVGAVFNTVFDPIFIFGFGWGVQGAGLATILGQIATCVMGLLYLRKFKTIHPTKHDYRIDLKSCGKIMLLGIASFITNVSIVIVMAVVNNLIIKYAADSKYGTDIPIAVVGIVMKINAILISIIIGIGSGTQPILGFNFGAGNLKRVKKAYFCAVICAEVISLIALIAFQCFPVQLISIFGSEGALYNEFAQKTFRIYLLMVLINGTQIISGMFEQAIGHSLKSSAISLSRQIILLIPAELIFAAWLGVDGILWAQPVADAIAFVIAIAIVIYDFRKFRNIEKNGVTA